MRSGIKVRTTPHESCRTIAIVMSAAVPETYRGKMAVASLFMFLDEFLDDSDTDVVYTAQGYISTVIMSVITKVSQTCPAASLPFRHLETVTRVT